MSTSDAGSDTFNTSSSSRDVEESPEANASAPHLSAAPAMRFSGSPKNERTEPGPQPRGAARGRIIDARALSVVTAGPEADSVRGSFAAGWRRYAPAGAATMAAALAFMSGTFLAADRSGGVPAQAAKLDVAHHVPPVEPMVVKDPETTRQMAQMAIDVRLLSARVETLRAAVESHQSADGERALKKSVDAMRSGLEQSKLETARAFGQMTQKLDRLQHDPSAPKLAQIADRLDRIERRSAATSDITASISKPAAAVAPAVSTQKLVQVALPKPMESARPVDPPKPALKTAAPLPGPRIIMPAAIPDTKAQPKVISGYVLRDMEGEVAIVEGHGQIFELASGDSVPGIGRVEGFERRGGEWVVVTSRGLIISHQRN